MEMERVKQLQARGNGCYRDGRYGEARDCYSQALELLESLALSDNRSTEGAETASQLYANRAQTAIQERDFGAALADARLALKHNPRNEKAAVRQLIALENLERFETALELVDRVLDGKPVDGDEDWRWGRENAPALFQHCVSARRRLHKMLAKDREAAVKELNQLGKLVHDNQQLRINFGSLVPSQVPLGSFFDVSVNIGNEFGLFRRDMFKDGERVALKCELYDPQNGGHTSGSSPVRLEVRLDSDGYGDRGSYNGQDSSKANGNAVPIVLDAHGKAKFRVAIIRSDATGVDSDSPAVSKLAIKVSVHDESAQKWNLFPVVSLPIRLVLAESECLSGDPGMLGVHCCRPVRMHGLSQDILLAESPGSLGIGGKLWDSCLILTRYLTRHRELLAGKSAVELGSGLGLVGIYCSLLGARATLTDMAEVVPLIEYNIALNYPNSTSHQTDSSHRPRAVAHMWGSTDDQELLSATPDVVVLSDVVYDPESYAPLVSSLETFARTPDTVVLMAHRSRNPKEHQFFEMLGRSFSFELVDWQQDLNTTKAAEEAPSGATEVAREQVDPALQDVKIFRIARRSE